ncbi:hypothetical protein Poli38472_007405 [Pythium oligandrum]|uniref:Uncharacterized protein n=1 Tax=Pythium oligandrum TaxID=41045 RepID=A0A8K1CSZ0_PYTOL|nr:hypothetical protein Poli38472_007405 [Pythium oligandrum]|eukprot:TMW67733.1 hypothetical protein Poli38472_007405 [Pythium oligandrum]
MDTPPRDKRMPSAAPPKQLQARLKMQMESEMDVELAHPEMERMEEGLVHTTLLKPVDDDLDDEDLE